jgi:CHAD domain-containing protein
MTLLEKRMRSLSGDLAATISKLAVEVAPRSVHFLRTTIRRIESLVNFAHPDLDKKLERSMEKVAELRKRAGKVRDLDVQSSLLSEMANGSTTRDRQILAAILNKKRARQAERLAASARKLQESRLLSRLNRIAERASTAGSNSRPDPLTEANSQVESMAGEFSSHQMPGFKRLHDARIRLKRIRYVAEIAEESAAQKAFISELKAVQDAVGEWNDWVGLTRAAEKRFSDRVNCALLREARALLAARHSAAVTALDKFFLTREPAKKPSGSASAARAFTRSA